jgi:hypothetical protein
MQWDFELNDLIGHLNQDGYSTYLPLAKGKDIKIRILLLPILNKQF